MMIGANLGGASEEEVKILERMHEKCRYVSDSGRYSGGGKHDGSKA